MQREDYILREIEKIGMMLRAIVIRIMGKDENLAITPENQFKETNELLLDIGFDMDKFLQLDHSSIEGYLMGIAGMRGPNLELLGDLLKEMGLRAGPGLSQAYLEKGKYLYEFCNALDKTYSFERESKINQIRNLLI